MYETSVGSQSGFLANTSYPSANITVDIGKGTFGRHGSFPLRFGWIPKGLEAIRENPSIFKQEDAIVRLGVGKNMVTAMAILA